MALSNQSELLRCRVRLLISCACQTRYQALRYASKSGGGIVKGRTPKFGLTMPLRLIGRPATFGERNCFRYDFQAHSDRGRHQ